MATRPTKAAAQKAQATPEVSDVSAWKKDRTPTLELPSGKSVKARRSSLQVFMKTGLIPNSLMGIVQKAMARGVEPDLSDVAGDVSQINDMLKMIDDVVCFVITEPQIHPIPEKNDDGTEPMRDDELLYVDEVDDTDKMFIYQWSVGGTADLEQFRRESAAELAVVQRGEAVVGKTIRSRQSDGR